MEDNKQVGTLMGLYLSLAFGQKIVINNKSYSYEDISKCVKHKTVTFADFTTFIKGVVNE